MLSNSSAWSISAKRTPLQCAGSLRAVAGARQSRPRGALAPSVPVGIMPGAPWREGSAQVHW